MLLEIGDTLHDRRRTQPLTIVVCATLQPDDCDFALKILEDASGANVGVRFSLVVSPLFAREGSMLADLRDPPFWVIGTPGDGGGTGAELWEEMLDGITEFSAEARRAPIRTTMHDAVALEVGL